MKDKRTYTNKKEHGEDMSYENELKIHHSRENTGNINIKESEWI
jgi:hypothetical protein